jgi:hypothetical protein
VAVCRSCAFELERSDQTVAEKTDKRNEDEAESHAIDDAAYRVRRIAVAIIDATQSVPRAIASATKIAELMSFTFLWSDSLSSEASRIVERL